MGHWGLEKGVSLDVLRGQVFLHANNFFLYTRGFLNSSPSLNQAEFSKSEIPGFDHLRSSEEEMGWRKCGKHGGDSVPLAVLA